MAGTLSAPSAQIGGTSHLARRSEAKVHVHGQIGGRPGSAPRNGFTRADAIEGEDERPFDGFHGAHLHKLARVGGGIGASRTDQELQGHGGRAVRRSACLRSSIRGGLDHGGGQRWGDGIIRRRFLVQRVEAAAARIRAGHSSQEEPLATVERAPSAESGFGIVEDDVAIAGAGNMRPAGAEVAVLGDPLPGTVGKEPPGAEPGVGLDQEERIAGPGLEGPVRGEIVVRADPLPGAVFQRAGGAEADAGGVEEDRIVAAGEVRVPGEEVVVVGEVGPLAIDEDASRPDPGS